MEFHQVGQRPELRALTGLRGVAAVVVALAHFDIKLPYGLQAFVLWQDAAVDLFFCLSGFTLAYVYSAQGFQFSRYIMARLGRIYPLYLVTLLLVAAVYVVPIAVDPVAYPAKAAVTDFLLQLLMLNAWPLIGATGVHWNTPGWSISVEWLCYLLLFPALLRLKPPGTANARLLNLIGLAALSYALFTSLFDWRLPVLLEPHAVLTPWAYWLASLRGIIGFTAGWIVFSSFEQQDEIYAFCRRNSAVIWLSFGAVLVLWYFDLLHNHVLIFVFPFLVLAATDETSPTSRLLGWMPLHFLGVISYSIYMTHMIVFVVSWVAFKSAPPETWSMLMWMAPIGGTFAISVLSYYAIERPARDEIRRISQRWLSTYDSNRPTTTSIPAPD